MRWSKLKEELYLKRPGLENLRAAIRRIEGLEQELERSRSGLLASVNRFSQLIRNLNSGILVEDADRKIILANELFCSIFSISLAPEQLTGMDCAGSAETSKHLFKDPEGFVARIKEIVAARELVTGDILELTDGRMLVRHFIPVRMGAEYLGHMWRYEDVTNEKEGQRELQRLSLVASANEKGVIFTDSHGVISWANDGFVRLTGYSLSEIIGKTPLELCRGPLSQKESLRGMLEAFYAGRSFSIEVIHYRKDGSWFWGKATGQPIAGSDPKTSQFFAMFEDITDKKELELDLVEAKEQAEESACAKQEFLANMSHEIRTPLNAVLGMGRELRKTNLDGTQLRYLETINTAGENLLVIINDILDLSKIDAGKLHLESIGFSPAALLDRVSRVMQLKAEEKGLTLQVSLDGEIPPVLLGDPYRLNQVLLNLVSNAIKFTEKGTIDINCQLAGNIVDRTLVRFVVSDTGIGMDEHFVGRVFEKFVQEHRSVARKHGGTGLGMSICRQLTELMEGAISIVSKKGTGTTVKICIPFRPGEESDVSSVLRETLDTTIINGKRILLVEDNEINRLIATTVLGRYGAAITEAVNGLEAVNRLRMEEYDAVLMDVQMPVMDGWEATRTIREEIDRGIPIIALTANAVKGEEQNCLAAGMNAFVPKPFDEQQLISALAGLLSRRPGIAL